MHDKATLDKTVAKLVFNHSVLNHLVKYMTPDHLEHDLAALAHPASAGHNLYCLAIAEISVTELAAPYDMSLAAVSKHLKVLQCAGLVSRARDAQWRPCHLEAAPLQEVLHWVKDFRRFWDRNLDSLADYLRTKKLDGSRRKPARKKRL